MQPWIDIEHPDIPGRGKAEVDPWLTRKFVFQQVIVDFESVLAQTIFQHTIKSEFGFPQAVDGLGITQVNQSGTTKYHISIFILLHIVVLIHIRAFRLATIHGLFLIIISSVSPTQISRHRFRVDGIRLLVEHINQSLRRRQHIRGGEHLRKSGRIIRIFIRERNGSQNVVVGKSWELTRPILSGRQQSGFIIWIHISRQDIQLIPINQVIICLGRLLEILVPHI